MRISDETVKDILYKLDIIKKLFQYEMKPDGDNYDNNKSYTDVDICPEKYYSFTFLDKHLEIRRTSKSVNYHIRLYNFIPDWSCLSFNYASQVDPNLSENCIGCWSDFNFALACFVEIVRSLTEYKESGLF